MIGRGLERTAALWPDIERAYDWVHRAAHILSNEGGEDATKVQRRFDGLVAAITRHRAKAGSLAGAIEHFCKVTRSYRPGLFHCYAVPDRAPTTALSSYSARSATTSAVPPDARRPRRPSSCVVRSG